ncbi:MAG: hypothetical protein COA97_05695 [Flavobacteriales bacterium]|nr:MAG: hypothetical protein COA97_05695 [Flavobacteriales bacterium]
MKQTLIIISFFLTLNLLGQNLIEKVGEIEVQFIGHNYKLNSNDKLTKKKTNRKNRPYLNMYFDSSGTLLKAISFGKHHNTDLRLLNDIKIYSYDRNGIKLKVDIWETDYEKNLSNKYFITFDLDSTKSKIISEKMYKVETDSIFIQTDYWYNKDGQYQGIIYDSSYYYKREYNEKGKLETLQQIFDGKLRWKLDYTYKNCQRIGIFQTYYNDGKDYSTKEIQTYNNQGLLIETKEVHTSKDGIDEKTKIYYGDNGVIKRIKYYELYNTKEGYELISHSDIKVNSKLKIDSRTAERINELINIK